MRPLAFATLLVLSFPAQAQQPPGATPSVTDVAHCRASVETFARALSSHDVSLFAEVLTPDWEDIPLAPGQGPGPDGIKGVISRFLQEVPDYYYRLEDVAFGKGVITTRATNGGTPKGTFFGRPTNGKPFEIFANDFHYVRPSDCKIYRTYHAEDWLSAMAQVGAWPPKAGQ